MPQEENTFHIEIMDRLSKQDVLMGVINEKCDGINRRLDVTNGRIAKVEGLAQTNERDVMLLKKSEQSEQDSNKRKQVWVDWAGKSFISFVLMVVGALVWTILQKNDIVNLSTVPDQKYQEVNSITQPYENR